MARITQITYPVTSGPPKWDLVAALFDRSQGRFIYVTIKNGAHTQIYRLKVSSVQHADHTDDYWNIEGTATLRGGTGMQAIGFIARLHTGTKDGDIRFL